MGREKRAALTDTVTLSAEGERTRMDNSNRGISGLYENNTNIRNSLTQSSPNTGDLTDRMRAGTEQTDMMHGESTGTTPNKSADNLTETAGLNNSEEDKSQEQNEVIDTRSETERNSYLTANQSPSDVELTAESGMTRNAEETTEVNQPVSSDILTKGNDNQVRGKEMFFATAQKEPGQNPLLNVLG